MRALRYDLVGLALVVVGVSSCGPPECLLPRGSYNEGATLSREGWLLAQSCELPPYVSLIELSNGHDFAHYSIGLSSVPTTISLRSDGLLAIATSTGSLALTQLTAPPPLVPEADGYTYAPTVELWPYVVRQLDAVAVAWSNDGQRLAVVTRVADAPLKLEVRSAALELLTVHGIELQQATAGNRPYVVSWSPDDARVAISTDIFKSALLDADCVLLDLSSGAAQRLALANVYFVGDDVLVGTEQTVARTEESSCGDCDLGPVYRIQLAGGEIASRTELSGALRAVASCPALRTFVTADRVRCVPYEVAFNLIPSLDPRLRAADGQFSTLIEFGYWWAPCPVALVPSAGVEQWGANAP